MKKTLLSLFLLCMAVVATAQNSNVLNELKADPRKAYGTDYPYVFTDAPQTKAPKGYKPFYISHYGRHGSRYYWADFLYKQLDTLMIVAHDRQQLTPTGEAFYRKFMACKDELKTGVSELTQLGWDQHQGIARTMYNSFPEVFRKGGDVMAVSSLVGRCVLSMSSFCLELKQCNPKIEIREQSSRFTLDAVVPDDRQNPNRVKYPKEKPRYEQHRDMFKAHKPLDLVSRVFSSTDGLPGNPKRLNNSLKDLYTTLPSILHEDMMEGIVTDQEIADDWEDSNLGTYSWLFGGRLQVIPILKDILSKADDVLQGRTQRLADLRFGHDSYLGPLTILMGINGADLDPEDPNEVKYCYQNWETCMASNIQLVFYRKSGSDDILVKCLLNGIEAKLPVPTQQYPYYRWSDFQRFYQQRCQEGDAKIEK